MRAVRRLWSWLSTAVRYSPLREDPALNTDEALDRFESETESRTREEHGDLVAVSGDLVDLYRRGLERVLQDAAKSETWPLPPAEMIELHLLVKTAGALQAGRLTALRGYYGAALGNARAIFKDIAYLMYFRRHPQ